MIERSFPFILQLHCYIFLSFLEYTCKNSNAKMDQGC